MLIRGKPESVGENRLEPVAFLPRVVPTNPGSVSTVSLGQERPRKPAVSRLVEADLIWIGEQKNSTFMKLSEAVVI